MDKEKLKSIREQAKFLEVEFKIPFAHALLLSSQMEIHDRLCEVRTELQNLWTYDEGEITKENKEPWENSDGA